jgi:hypothetical protein
MNFTLNPGQGGFLLALFALWSLFVTVFWMVVGWRAMRAHESLASANRELADEVHRWRRAAEQKAVPTGPAQAASAADEARITDTLLGTDRNA